MREAKVVPFAVFEPADDAYRLGDRCPNYCWSDDHAEVLSAELWFERTPDAWIRVATRVLTGATASAGLSRADESHARDRLRWDVMLECYRASGWSAPEMGRRLHEEQLSLTAMARTVQRSATAGEDSIDVDTEPTPCLRLTHGEYFAVVVRLDGPHILAHGCRPPARLALRART